MQSSTYIVDGHAQADGRRYVTEQHTDVTGRVHTSLYLAPLGWTATEMDARLATTAAQLDASLANDEAQQAVTTDTMPALAYQTGVEFAARFWAHARNVFDSDKTEWSRLMWWLTNRLVAGDISDAAARNTFNAEFGRSLTAAQWTTLRANRITPAHDRYAAMIAETEL